MKDQPWLKSLQRPSNYADLSPEDQWAIDKELGILDWAGCTVDQGLRDLLAPYDRLTHLECDGFTRVATYLLAKAGIEHQCFIGTYRIPGYTIAPHYWIEAGEWTVDYRPILYTHQDSYGMRWRYVGSRPVSQIADDVMVPRGVFRQEDHPEACYQRIEAVNLEVTDLIFEILTVEGVDAKESAVLRKLGEAGL